jgi:nitroreductase
MTVIIDRRAPTAHPINDVLAERWSPRAFADRTVDHDKLLSLFEAARWAPSSFNEQPWRFIVAAKEDSAAYERILSCLIEFNQAWARTAPVLMLSLCSTLFAKNGKVNPHAWHDTGMAMMSLVVQATTFGLYVHQMAGFDGEKVRRLYSVPADVQPVAAAAIGYLGDPASLPRELREKEHAERSRREARGFVFRDRFGTAAPLAG